MKHNKLVILLVAAWLFIALILSLLNYLIFAPDVSLIDIGRIQEGMYIVDVIDHLGGYGENIGSGVNIFRYRTVEGPVVTIVFDTQHCVRNIEMEKIERIIILPGVLLAIAIAEVFVFLHLRKKAVTA